MSVCELPLSQFYQERVLNFAHRGARMQAPENTIPAFERAADVGADGVELDVQLTSDGYPAVIHDFELSKTTNGQGLVSDQLLASLRELDAGSYFDAKFAGTRIPTLHEVFEAIGQRLLINIELKYFGGEPRLLTGLAESVVQCIRQHALEKRVLVSSFNPLALRRLKRIAADIPTGFLHDPKMPWPLRNYMWLAALIIGRYEARHPHYSMATEQYVRGAHAQGRRVNVWTVNELDDIRRMYRLGVDMIMSDYPDRVRRILSGSA